MNTRNKPKLGKLERIKDIRSVWGNEARDFSRWLAEEENLNDLGKVLGLDLELIHTEEKIGEFRADLFARDSESGKAVIIENQLEESNHKHLGQILTYAAGKDASTVVWIVKHARQEHAKAIEWLNSHLDQSIDFFLIEIELWKIDNSPLAPNFNVVEGPNAWGKNKKSPSEKSDAEEFRLEFWSDFYEYLQSNDRLKGFSWGRPSNRLNFQLRVGTMKAHLFFTASYQKKELSISMYIKNNDSINRALQNLDSWNCTLQSNLSVSKDKNLTLTIDMAEINIENPESWTVVFDKAVESAIKMRSLLMTVV
ncbi:DUF4268 domain-containing protein [uncultured Parasutterella sp.]|uniref:DUF4268 domain-containing protein n=1 Tax=uncultured Parasutterella sp. TaxID=1263098 RepID=UPI002594BDF9|nr:DUF4268 domain-containing protein [uncultured Parasutterella sp.]